MIRGGVEPMCENPSWRTARLAAGREGVEILVQDRGTEGFEHSCDKTGEQEFSREITLID